MDIFIPYPGHPPHPAAQSPLQGDGPANPASGICLLNRPVPGELKRRCKQERGRGTTANIINYFRSLSDFKMVTRKGKCETDLEVKADRLAIQDTKSDRFLSSRAHPLPRPKVIGHPLITQNL